MNSPFFSIVIANYNYGRFLDEAIQSVLSQSCQDFELIVVDGGSTDNSVEVIKKYADRIAWWCSEKDNGQSHAFNKGFARAKGKMLTWLNADDIFFPGTLAQVKEKAKNILCPDKAWIVGGCFWLTPDMRVIRCSRARPFSRMMAHWNLVPVWAPSSFFSKSLLDAAGGFDERFHYMMDTELWLRFVREQAATYLPVSSYCWGLRLHPDAKMSGHNFADSPKADPKHPARQQEQKEKELANQLHGKRGMPFFIRLFTALSPLYIRSRVDTWRTKGMKWQDAIKTLNGNDR
ncbi:MAG TPA: glycosyltransferase family 2 protein [bacterium]|nr:glycosyltransferase family 2 protein [bacterium]